MKTLTSFLLVISSTHFNGQVQLLGITELGGANTKGNIFQYTPSTSTFTNKFDFSLANGGDPQGAIIQASDGFIYGMTQLGGTKNTGVLFQFDPSTSTYADKFNFDTINGSGPQGSLIQATNGKLYGMTYNGGSYGVGVIFEYDPSTSIFIKKFDFDTINGSNPMGSLVEAANGNLYGMTYHGGLNGYGVLFQFNPNTSVFTKKLDFNSTNGSSPMGSLVAATNGKLYGLTYIGGANGDGVLFQYDPSTSIYTKKFDFLGSTSGRYIGGTLMQASDGNLYGMSIQGGANNFGVLFQYNPSTSTYTKKHDFTGADGANPYGAMMQASDGIIYGMTYSGGTNNIGVLFQYDPGTSAYTKRIDFTGTNGFAPFSNNLIEVNSLNSINSVAKDFQFSIYPNPANTHLFIASNSAGQQMLNLYDFCGRHVLNKTFVGTTDVDVSTLSNGLYTLSIKSFDGLTTKKLVVSH